MPQIYVTDDRLIALAPEFALLDQAFRELWIDFTKQFIDLTFWGECAEGGHFFATGHFLETAPTGGIDGPDTGAETGVLTGEGNGPGSRSFSAPKAAAAGGSAGWESSSYGRKYLLLAAKIRPKGAILAVRSGFNKGMSRVPRMHRF